MMAPPSPHQSTDRKRVKVYELRNNDWFDRGTGFCIANYSPDKESKVVVESEDQPERILLETRITRDDSFQKQQETLIVWTEPTNGLDMALSFQEADGCNLIWRFISTVQQGFGPGAGPDDSLSDDLAMEMAAPIALPPAELANLHELEHNMRIMSATGSGRDALAKAIMHEDYIRKLIPLVEMAEDLESLGDLHTLCNIMKIILLLNDTGIIEHAVSDDCVLGVVGALEYDPDFPRHKANHRQWLSNQGRYKEVVRIQDDQIRRKIHQTYRLQYLKDVVLARILDDPTFSVLNSLIFFNQVDIVQHLQTNSAFLKDLFGIFSDPNEDVLRKKEAVLFIQQCCAIAKNLQPPARNNLYTNFLNHGLLQVIDFGLRNLDVSARVGATDIFVSMIDHDPQMIRHTIYRQIHEKDSPLTDTLIDLLLVEVDLGIKSQVSDALKVLLDPNPPGPPPEQFMTKGPNGELQPRPRPPPPPVDPQQEIFLTYFYDHSALRLFRPLLDLETRSDLKFSALNDGIFGYLNEILCFYVRQHQHRIKFFVLQHNLAQRFTQLLGCREKHLQLVAIRFFRQLVTLQDEFYIRHLIEKRIFGPVLDVLIDTLPRDNLLCSACLDLFALIAKEQKPRELVQHLIENYRDKIELLSYLEPFSLLLKAGTQPPPGPHSAIDAYYIEHEDELPGRRPTNTGARGLMEHIAIDPDEEAYYNVSDDEEEHLQLKAGAPPASINGAPLGKPLVDYPSDEELDDIADAIALAPREVERNDEDSAIVDDDAMSNHSSMSSGAPPERLSEKRRREEDEEDELGKLVYHKRRNSSSASMNAAANAAALRRKKSLTGQGAAPRKIAISISSTIKTPAAQTPAKEEEAV